MFILRFTGLFLICLLFSVHVQAQTGLELVNKMLDKGLEIKTLKYDMKMKERVKGKYQIAKNSFKIQVSPFKMYLKQEYPLKEMEILYVEGTNNNKVLVHPSGFPWTNVNLDPNSTHMRKNLHHPVMESGLTYVYSIIKYLMEKNIALLDKIITYEGNITWKGAICYKISMQNPGFKYQSYTVQPGETPFSIAKKFKINDYMVIDKNPDFQEFDDCKPGMTIIIPVDYASKMEIWLDQKLLTPVIMRIYDDVSLYEEFEFSNMIINYKFQSSEFTSSYKEYNF